jgi:hypothetical protein
MLRGPSSVRKAGPRPPPPAAALGEPSVGRTEEAAAPRCSVASTRRHAFPRGVVSAMEIVAWLSLSRASKGDRTG